MTKRISPAELAERLNVSRTTVYRLARAGHIPAERLPPRGHLRFDEAAVTRAMQSAGQGATQAVAS
jgi:excisionase family DNA binding protein